MAFPPADVGPLALIGLVPLFIAISGAGRARRAGLCGFVFGLVFFGAYLHFLLRYGVVPWLAATAYQAIFPLIFGLAAGSVMRSGSAWWRVLGLTASWTLVAYLRHHAPVAFSGGNIAYSQHDQLAILQVASIVGQLGLTMLIVAVNAGLAEALLRFARFTPRRGAQDRRSWQREGAAVAVVCYAVFIGAYLWGGIVLLRRHPETGRPLKVAVVQGDVRTKPPVDSYDLGQCQATYLSLNETVPQDTGLTVWPETALPAAVQTHPLVQQALENAARENDGYLLAGVLEHVGTERYNSLLLYDGRGELVGRYRKVDLVIFGEYVPFREHLSFIERYPIRKHDLTPGEGRKVFDMNGVKLSPLICFEGIFSGPTREVCRLGAEVVVIATGDTWAQGTAEVPQHSRTAPMRAVESRKYLCRAATSGVSAIYSPYGEILERIPIGSRGRIVHQVRAREGLSVYHRIGDLPVIAFCLIVYCLAVWLRPRG